MVIPLPRQFNAEGPVPIDPTVGRALTFNLTMKPKSLFVLSASLVGGALASMAEPTGPHALSPVRTSPYGRDIYPAHGVIERLSPALDQVLAPNAKMEKLADGFVWSEGPVWLRRENSLVFSDVPANKAYRWSNRDGLSVYLDPSGYTGNIHHFREPGSNGLTTDSKGNLVLCQHGNRQIARLVGRSGTTGTFEPLVPYFNGRKFNSPNDLCFARNGDLYFTDPPYGLEGLNKNPLKELINNGVYVAHPDGRVVEVTGSMTFPNGIALSPDQKKLYVNQSDPSAPVTRVFTLKADGTADEGKVFFDARDLAQAGRPGMPDGLKVDALGNLWSTGPGGVLILSPTGEHLGTLLTGEPTANCNWGEDGTVLYITSNHSLLRIQTLVRGAGL